MSAWRYNRGGYTFVVIRAGHWGWGAYLGHPFPGDRPLGLGTTRDEAIDAALAHLDAK